MNIRILTLKSWLRACLLIYSVAGAILLLAALADGFLPRPIVDALSFTNYSLFVLPPIVAVAGLFLINARLTEVALSAILAAAGGFLWLLIVIFMGVHARVQLGLPI
jgi:hypothetical protein